MKKKPFYLRGFLKEQNLSVKQLGSSKVTIRDAEKFFDDEDERHNVKMMIKDFMLPSKKNTAQSNFRLFGMKPEEYEKDY